MAAILPYLQDDAFQPDDIKAMSMALDDVCKELKLDGNANAKRRSPFASSSWHDAASVARQSCAIEFCAKRTIPSASAT